MTRTETETKFRNIKAGDWFFISRTGPATKALSDATPGFITPTGERLASRVTTRTGYVLMDANETVIVVK